MRQNNRTYLFAAVAIIILLSGRWSDGYCCCSTAINIVKPMKLYQSLISFEIQLDPAENLLKIMATSKIWFWFFATAETSFDGGRS